MGDRNFFKLQKATAGRIVRQDIFPSAATADDLTTIPITVEHQLPAPHPRHPGGGFIGVLRDMARKTAAEKAAERTAGGAGHNLPPRDTYDAFLDRLHIINDRMEEDNGQHRADMKAIYDEMVQTLDMPIEVVTGIFKADRREQKAQKKAAKMGSREKAAYEKLAAAYGSDSPLGQYAARMATAAGRSADAAKASDTETDSGTGEAANDQVEGSEEAAAETAQA